MPIVELHLLEGYDKIQKQRLSVALTSAVRFVVPAAPDLVTVLIHETPAQDYYRGGVPRKPAPARADPEQTVRSFLDEMAVRALEKAQARLAPGFVMNFPGAKPMHALQELIEWAAPRYRFVTKTYEGFDALQGAGDAAIVYCRGTLSGEWPDGTPFGDIRFIDRFEIVDDLITRQDVWNDIAETKAQA
ncbi:tautomerase family protein [Aliiruegeria lutimaris]|uniref:Phenylpyruvate tautomerase PptA, 4-oxalocrotonate tautomerase family n=1 Tax=Aliiruegeria lutimaris TaxID=571298 RepID=A0A1G9L534_9RHOB|nr:tautomerase family protein [Aliiruegeria lutimaris]SDL56695.1 Phenylpyruvate tautomerase PptA, 4-oxalocrotonate tautomerase family [Aliiruegeria lutimaris]